MSVLLIQNATGESEIRELSKHIPVAIGRHSSNDIRIDEDGVAVLHCRVSWNSRGYEVVAGTDKGIEFNGRKLANAILTLGDCVQVGSVSLFYYDSSEQAEAALRGESVEPENPPPLPDEKRVALELKQEAQRGKPKHGELGSTPVRPRATKPPPVIPVAAAKPDDSLDEIPIPVRKAPPAAEPSRGIFRSAPVRPGQQDLMRSPLVTTLGVGTIILVMMSLALWFVIGRDSSQKAYQLAVSEMEQKRFSQAIAQFESFIKTYPSHRYVSAARHALGLAQIEQPIAGAAPAWDRGLKALDEYVAQHRRDKDFSDILPKVLDLAERIGKGAAESAGTQKKGELLTVSNNASRLLQQYSPLDKPPKQALQEIDTAIQKAEAAIRKHETFQKALGQIDDSLKKNTPFAAFDTRRKLLLKYPDLEADKALQTRLKQALEAERKLTVRSNLDQAAQTAELPAAVALPSLNLMRQTRTRADTVPGGTNVFTVAQDCCFAADSLTGILQWRRVIGSDTPFPPQPVSLDVLGLLLFDTRVNELILVRQRDGVLIWRHGLPAPAAAAPLVHAGQIFIPTRDGRLSQLDLVTGKLTTQLKFSQPLVTSPLLVANGERLLVAGARAVLYSLNYRPLECVSVTYTGHAPGSIQSPLMKMGDFVLTAENDRQDSAQLRVWDGSQADQPLSRLAAARVKGQVRDPAVLRGKQLIVPSSPEHLSSFTVSDEKGEQALAAVGTYQSEHPQGGPIYVTLGPDNDLWMTSSTLRRLQIGPDSILPQKGELGLGISTQPVQVLDQVLYATSRVAWNSATYFLAADRQQMVSQWLSVLASRAVVAGTTPAADGSIPLLTDAGDLFSLTAAKVKAGGVDIRPVTTLSVPTGLIGSLGGTVLSNGRLVVWCGGAKAKLWLVNTDGIVIRESRLTEPLEAAPILLSGGLLLPLPGKLRLIETPEFKGTIEDLMPAVDPQGPARWKGAVSLDDKQAIAVTDKGRVIRAQVRAEPVPHVAEVSSLDLKTGVEQPPVLIGNRVFLATSKQLQSLDVATLESRGSVPLPEVVSQGPWVVQNLLVMVCGRGQLVVVHSEPLAVAWKQQLSPGGLAGAPQLRGEQLLFASQSGEVSLRKLTDGTVVRKISTGQPIALGPLMLQEQVFVGSLDGSVVLLNPWLEAMP
ncbi:MAG: bamB 1 [Planctomycetaceae bacterium]|nr:bamB 1 [Planctomycetaceae bacterium]